MAERHNEIVLNNNARPLGIKKIFKANYGKVNGGKNPNAKGTGRADPYPCGNNARRSRGRGGRRMRRGGSSKV